MTDEELFNKCREAGLTVRETDIYMSRTIPTTFKRLSTYTELGKKHGISRQRVQELFEITKRKLYENKQCTIKDVEFSREEIRYYTSSNITYPKKEEEFMRTEEEAKRTWYDRKIKELEQKLKELKAERDKL